MYRKVFAYGTTVHVFEFDPECYWWTIEIGKRGQLETLAQIAPDADYAINWSVFDWDTGKDGYGRQNGKRNLQVIRGFQLSALMVSSKKANFEAYPDFLLAGCGRNGKALVDYIVPGNHNVKDAGALGQLKNGNSFTTEGTTQRTRV